MLYEHKIMIEIDELESLLLDLSNCETLTEIYNEIDSRLKAKKEIIKTIKQIRKEAGQYVVFNYEGRK